MDRIVCSSNLDLASFWALRGLQLRNIDGSSPPRSIFRFHDPDARADALTREYWRSEVALFVAKRMELRRALRPFDRETVKGVPR